jgi:hypothetical protein
MVLVLDAVRELSVVTRLKGARLGSDKPVGTTPVHPCTNPKYLEMVKGKKLHEKPSNYTEIENFTVLIIPAGQIWLLMLEWHSH